MLIWFLNIHYISTRNTILKSTVSLYNTLSLSYKNQPFKWIRKGKKYLCQPLILSYVNLQHLRHIDDYQPGLLLRQWNHHPDKYLAQYPKNLNQSACMIHLKAYPSYRIEPQKTMSHGRKVPCRLQNDKRKDIVSFPVQSRCIICNKWYVTII